jgi:membrane protease YdiL (CAAX protease family)
MNYWTARTALTSALKLLIAFFGFVFVFSLFLSHLFKVPIDHFRRLRLVIEFGKATDVLTVISLSNILAAISLMILAKYFFDFQFRRELHRITFSKAIFFTFLPLIIILPSFIVMLVFDRQVSFTLREGFVFNSPILFFLLVVAFTEEVVFRFVLFKVILNTTRNIYFTILLTSVLFTFAHILNGLPFVGILSIFLCGALLGLILVKTRSLVYAIIFHFFWNFFQGPILGFRVSGLTFPSLFDINIENGNLLNGGSFGLEGSVIALFFLTLTVGLGFLKKTQRA